MVGEGNTTASALTTVQSKMHLLTGEEKCSDTQELETVSGDRCGCQEAVHDIHRQAAAFKGQTEVSVNRDEPADQLTPSFCCQLQDKH